MHVLGDLYHGETLQLMINRWCKLEKDFKQEQGKFDISKIPDIYDCIKYDLLHNRYVRACILGHGRLGERLMAVW